MRSSSAKRVLSALLVCVSVFAGAVRADVLLDTTSLAGLPGAATPSEYSFSVTTAQAMTLTLTDLQQPTAFGSLEVAVTLGDTLVGTATLTSPTLAIPAATGNYTLHVVGVPNSAQGFGNFGVCVAPATSAGSCIAADSFSGSITTPAAASSTGTSALNTNFTSTVAGSYTVTLTDDMFPVALQSVSAGIFLGSTPVLFNIPAGTPTKVTLQAGTMYQLLIPAIANAATQAGLYGIQITDPTGAVVFGRTLPVGTLAASTIVNNPVAQGLNVSLTDYVYPAALTSVGVAVTQGSAALEVLTAPGTATNFPAAAGNVEVWQYAVAGAQPGTYGLSLAVYQSSSTANPTTLFSTTQVVNSAPGSAATSYAFIATLPSAGTYNLVANDFQFPSSLASISATVAQNGTVLQQTSGNFTAMQGPVVVLVNAAPPASGIGIFGVTVQSSGAAPQVVLDQTQAVGGIFNTRVINLGTSGGYGVTLADLGFPQNFQNLAVVVSQDGQVLGKIYGGGTFQFSGTPGQYVVSLVATPASQSLAAPSLQNYGLYSLNISSAAPTVSLSASAASVPTGSAVTLTWSSQSATACTGSGGAGWTGSQATSGTLAVVVGATETLTLTCTGPGGSAAQSVTVTATAAASSGGGGAIDLAWLAALMSLAAASCQRRLRGLDG
jgi:hypothetical protein